MTKNYFIEQADYNIWANDIVHSWFEKITDEQWQQPIVSSFKSLEKTSLHTAGAEKIWLERLYKVETPVFLTSEFKGSKQDAIEIWKKTSGGLRSFIGDFNESKIMDEVSFTRPDNKTYTLMHFQIFGHVFNHSTYHRGQIVTMLRQVGFADLRSIDMSTYFWSKKK